MTLDWDGRIRMDPSSPYAMQRLIGLKDRFDIAFACDTDHDRHGIVAPSAGLLPPNHYLAVAIDYLFRHRPRWSAAAAVGKTVVSSAMIDRVARKAGAPALRSAGRLQVVRRRPARRLAGLRRRGERRRLVPAPRRHGLDDRQGRHRRRRCWPAEITARTGRDPGVLYRDLARELGAMAADRVDAPATRRAEEAAGGSCRRQQVKITELAGEPIRERADPRARQRRPPSAASRSSSDGGWFAARPSGTENIYKIYAESFRDEQHLQSVLDQAQLIVDATLSGE